MMAALDDNRKRNLADEDDITAILSSKRAALRDATASSGTDIQDHLIKILCPSAVVGSIIGRGGSVINLLNQSTCAKIKVSQTGEFFPTTNDRVLAISGSMTAISAALQELVTKMIESPDKQPVASADSSSSSNTPIQLRILIPATASGVMIGRQGSVIRTMSEASSCVMQLAELNDPQNTKERIMTISNKDGQLPYLVHGAQLAMRQLFSDAVAGAYLNGRTSYGPVTGPGPRGPGMVPSFFPQQHYNQGPPDYMLQGGRVGAQDLAPMGMDPAHYQRHNAYQQQQQAAYNPSQAHALKASIADISPPTYSIDGQNIVMTIGIPDILVGSILGRQGCVVKEIMSLSGAVIQISQKEQYLPDTKNRAVTVVGLQHQIQIALSLIMTKAQAPPFGGR